MVLFIGNGRQQFSPHRTGRGLEVFVQAHEIQRKLMPHFGSIGTHIPLTRQWKTNAQWFTFTRGAHHHALRRYPVRKIQATTPSAMARKASVIPRLSTRLTSATP